MCQPGSIAFLIPLRCAAEDIEALLDLLSSITVYEGASHCVVVVHDGVLLPEWEFRLTSAYQRIILVKNPRSDVGYGRNGALTCGILHALELLVNTGHNPACVVKMDTDALVIRPFVKRLLEIVAYSPNVAVLGTLGATPRKTWSRYYEEIAEPSPFCQFVDATGFLLDDLLCELRLDCFCEQRFATCFPSHLNILQDICDTHDQRYLPDRDGKLEPITVEVLALLVSLIKRAQQKGFVSRLYCAGGTYAITSEFIKRLARMGLLATNLFWRYIPYGEDQITGLLTFAAGMTLADCSEPGDIFGVQIQGLPYRPEVLCALGYSLIHSVRYADGLTEDEIRRYFREMRINCGRTAQEPTVRRFVDSSGHVSLEKR